MLPSFQNAHNEFGKQKAVLAHACGVKHNQFWQWSTGRARCPLHKRKTVDRAFEAPVDWVQYDIECAALERLEAPKVSPAPQPTKAEQQAPSGAKRSLWDVLTEDMTA